MAIELKTERKDSRQVFLICTLSPESATKDVVKLLTAKVEALVQASGKGIRVGGNSYFNEDGSFTVQYVFLGKEMGELVDSIKSILIADPDLKIEVNPTLTGVPEEPAIPEGTTSPIIPPSTLASVYSDCGIQVGHRVVVNDGTTANPIYLTGTVTEKLDDNRKITILLDNEATVTESVNDLATGLVGCVRNHRVNKDPIKPHHLPKWIDLRKWHAKSLVDSNRPGYTLPK